MSALYLASNSPRRRQLLAQLGVTFQQLDVEVDEAPLSGETASDYVMRLALAKARAGRCHVPAAAVVLAADTAVILEDKIFGKPADQAEALAMLQQLSGRTHQVLTAVALIGKIELQRLSSSEVSFRPLTPAECRAYWHTGEPADKAGAYAIQGLGAVFVDHLSGSYSGVMGLPLFETAQMLQQAGIEVW